VFAGSDVDRADDRQLFRSFVSRTSRTSSEQTIRNHLPVAVALGIVNVLLRRASLPRLSGGTGEAGASKRSPLPLRQSRERYARAVDRRARRVPDLRR
jgi:hypothetical protein